MVPERLAKGLERLGARFRIVTDPGIFEKARYLAGSDERRAAELNRFFRDPDVRAIIVGRGGYGIMRILPLLDAAALRADPKVLVGFSDCTALLCWALATANVRGIHGPVASQLADLPAEDAAWLYRLLEDPQPLGTAPFQLHSVGRRARGAVAGRLVGGNLSLLSHLVGTPYEIDLDQAVLLVEDLGERPYAIDRYFTHLGLAGRLDRLAAALIGDFTRCEHGLDGPVEDVIDERLRAYGVAALGGLPSGHGERNVALPFGGRCELDFDRGLLRLVDAAVG